jgi:hypothetical protein
VGKKIAKSLKTRGIDSGVKELNKHHKAIKKDIKAELEKYTSFGTKTIPTSKNFQINDAEDHIKRYEKVLKSYLEEEKESADDEAESAASDNNDFRKESPLTNKESGNTCFDLNVYLINKKCSKRRLVISMDFVFSVVAGIIIGLIFNGGII